MAYLKLSNVAGVSGGIVVLRNINMHIVAAELFSVALAQMVAASAYHRLKYLAGKQPYDEEGKAIDQSTFIFVNRAAMRRRETLSRAVKPHDARLPCACTPDGISSTGIDIPRGETKHRA